MDAEVAVFFDTYVRWMYDDIEREIELEKRTRSAGNLLCALGLLVYTEALGRVRRWHEEHSEFFTDAGQEQPARNFMAAFRRLDGGNYGNWHDVWVQRYPGTSVYEILRSGLVHEYRPKVRSRIWFGHEQPFGIEETTDEHGPLLAFYIVPYLRHFQAEAAQLRATIAVADQATMPQPFIRRPDSLPPSLLSVPQVHSVSGSSVASGPDLSALTEDERMRIFRKDGDRAEDVTRSVRKARAMVREQIVAAGDVAQ